MKIDFRKELNDEQYKPVVEGDGASLVLAGAGSGKTRTLTYRVAYLIEKGVNPENILLVTFTNKASKEMLDRVESILGYYPKGIWGGTFHHIANRLLRQYAEAIGYTSNFTILDREDSNVLMKQCYDELVNDENKSRYFPKVNVLSNLNGYARNKGVELSALMKTDYEYLSPKEISLAGAIADSYREKKLASNAMDFDDLLINWLKLLTSNSKIREKLSNQFQYILVDEYQDTNKIQDSIIKILAERHKNIMVVGDDSQSIYSFRAADISNILDFGKNFENTKIYKLETNYRSTPQILKLANSSIMNNRNKFVKNLTSVREDSHKPSLIVNGNGREQADFISKEIADIIDQGENPPEIAVLFRSAFQALELELELNRRGIPYIMRGGIKFFEQKHIKDVISYLKILANHKDEIAWKRLLMIHEGVGAQTANKIFGEMKKFESLKEALSLLNYKGSAKVTNSLQSIIKTLNELIMVDKEIIRESIKIILKNGYSDYLRTSFDNFLDRTEDLNQLADFSADKELNEFLTATALSENFKNKQGDKQIIHTEEKEEDKIILSTIHQAKGLEWNNVFVIGLSDGQFPHHRVYDKPNEIEEERRLFYVAVTRAKNKLYLTFPMMNNQSEGINRQSIFLEELQEDLFSKKENDEFNDLPIIEYE